MTSQAKALILGLSLALSSQACGKKSNVPVVPVSSTLANGSGNPANGSSDSNPVLGSTSPIDATVPGRLAALPNSVQNDVKGCEAEAPNRLFHLGDLLCVDAVPLTYPCKVDDQFKAQLDPSTIEKFDAYLAGTAKDSQLYFCSEEAANVLLHFYKYEQNVIKYNLLRVPKKAT